METVYRSKIDKWLLVVLVLAMGVIGFVTLGFYAGAFYAGASTYSWWYGALFAVLAIGLPAWVLLATHYTFERRELLVRSGPFRWRIPVAEITNIKPTSNPLSSPALSLDRLRIEYGRGRWIMVSPHDKEGFLREVEARRGRSGPEAR